MATALHPTIGTKSVGFKSPALSIWGGEQKRVGKRPPESPISAHTSSAPASKRARKTMEDIALVSPLPVVSFIKSLTKRKACGKCSLCILPVCGKCKACILNAKGAEKRRCEALRCIKLPEDDIAPVLPKLPAGQAPLPTTVEGITEEIADTASKLIEIAPMRFKNHETKLTYKMLLARKGILHSAQLSLRNIRARRKSRFSVGFPEAWGIINKLEKTRVKFAEYVTKQSPGNSASVVQRKRDKRDVLDQTIAEYCTRWSEELCPVEDTDAEKFWKLVGKPREEPMQTSGSSSDSEMEQPSDDDGSDSE